MAKKKSKAPKKPKRSASVKTWERYDERYKAWEKANRDKDAAEKKKQALIRKYT